MAGQLEYSSLPASNTTVNGIGIQGSSTIKNGDDALRQIIADAAASITRHVAKSVGSYTALKADFRQLWRATGAVTINLTAAATLTDGWCLFVKADGGDVTVDPNGTEQINGSATALTVGNGSSAFILCTGTAFYAIAFGDVTLAGTQTLTNKTLTAPIVNNPVLTLAQSAAPVPTVEGRVEWDTDDNVLAIGDGAATKLFVPIPASTAAGDIEYFTGAKVTARLAKGTAAQVLQMNAGATAPEWATIRKLTVASSGAASGTAVQATGIPTWVNRITVAYSELSTNGTSVPMVQIGDADGFETTGYVGSTSEYVNSSGGNTSSHTAGFGICQAGGAGNSVSGIIVLVKMSPGTWAATIGGTMGGVRGISGGGAKTLGGTAVLDRVRIAPANGTDAFDAGSVTILYE